MGGKGPTRRGWRGGGGWRLEELGLRREEKGDGKGRRGTFSQEARLGREGETEAARDRGRKTQKEAFQPTEVTHLTQKGDATDSQTLRRI